MQGLGRAIYTRCSAGVDFNSIISLQEGQQIFSTSGNMGLPRETIKLIEKNLKEDLYRAGNRPFKGDVCRFINYGTVSVLFYYRWLEASETGSREFGLTKALIGNFDCHPVEYFSSEFFNSSAYFYGYLDANMQEIQTFKQLLTFNTSHRPRLFDSLQKSVLNSTYFPAITFENTGKYVGQSEYIAERVKAAVCHLVKQFGLPEQQRQGIIIKYDRETIRYTIAAICYAFSGHDAHQISFSIGLPPSRFAYHFSTDMLVGWDTADEELKDVVTAPPNFVFLEALAPADNNSYYKEITQFSINHTKFINYVSATKKAINLKDYPSQFKSYIELIKTNEQRQEQRLEQQKLEQQKLEQQKLEQPKLEQQKLEQPKLEQQKLEQQKLEQQKLEQPKLEQQKPGKGKISNRVGEVVIEPNKEITTSTLSTISRKTETLSIPIGIKELPLIRMINKNGALLDDRYGTYYGQVTEQKPNGWGASITEETKSWKIGQWGREGSFTGFVFPTYLKIDRELKYHSYFPDQYSPKVYIVGLNHDSHKNAYYIGDCRNGWGAAYFIHLHQGYHLWYVGQWSDGQYHGWGVLYTINFKGSSYMVGTWQNGKRKEVRTIQ